MWTMRKIIKNTFVQIQDKVKRIGKIKFKGIGKPILSQLKRTTKDVNDFKFVNQVLFKILQDNILKYRSEFSRKMYPGGRPMSYNKDWYKDNCSSNINDTKI